MCVIRRRRLAQLQAELAAVSKENKKLVEAKNALDRVARERASATEKIEKNVDVFKSKAAAAAAAAATADAKTKQSLQAQAEMQAALAEAKKETAAAKAEAAAASKKLEALDRKRALGDSDLAILETESMDDNPEALKHKCGGPSSKCHNFSPPNRACRLEVLFRARAEDRKRHARDMKELKAGAEAQVEQQRATAQCSHIQNCPACVLIWIVTAFECFVSSSSSLFAASP
jgi:hypothetical protein